MFDMFDFKKVEDDASREEIFRLRYKVYCDEWGFEKPEDHPQGIEKDDFDGHSVHFIVRRKEDGLLIGTVRLILASELGFPFEKHCFLSPEGTGLLRGLNRLKGAEISRLAVSKEYRKRVSDRYYDNRDLTNEELNDLWDSRRRLENNIVVGLYRCLYKESLMMGLTHLHAVMARGLFLILKRLGVMFTPVGQEVDYHGLRTPYVGIISEILQTLQQHNPELFSKFDSKTITKDI
jgi:N-acyl amino acid synthase of PEP-CTERM/exosortase system